MENKPAPQQHIPKKRTVSEGILAAILAILTIGTVAAIAWQWGAISGLISGENSTGEVVVENANSTPQNTNELPDWWVNMETPNLYVAQRDGVFYAAYDEESKEYAALVSFAAPTDVVKMNTIQDAVFLYRPDVIERYSHDGVLEKTWERSSSSTYVAPEGDFRPYAEELQDAFYYQEHIYAAVNRSLVVLDEQLNEVGTLTPLDREQVLFGKAIDDVMVFEDFAFLVDDILQPIYVFSVDVGDPTSPKLVRTLDMSGVYGTVSSQWYDHRNEQWCMQRTTSSGYVGSYANVYCAPKEIWGTPREYATEGDFSFNLGAADTTQDLNSFEIGYRPTSEAHEDARGFEILGDLNLHDDFTLIQSYDAPDAYLAGLGDDYTIEAKLKVGEYLDRANTYLYRFGPYIFLYGDDRLNVYRQDGETLTLVFQQAVPKVEVETGDQYNPTALREAWLTFAADPRREE